jgi:tetratricopeptide (TPR) repeat protein
MKSTERHRLKQNELTAFTRRAADVVDERRREITGILIVIIVASAAWIAYSFWRARTDGKAHVLLAEALIAQQARIGPPAAATGTSGLTFPTERERAEAAAAKFKQVADTYPSTEDGIFARSQEAASLMALDKPAEAVKAYQQVIDRSGDRLQGQMARLGMAEAQARAGQYDQAINAFKELAQRKDGPLPIDGILMQLGRAYLDAGRPNDAQQTFNRLVEEFPDSPFNAEARRQLESLKKA